MNYLVVYLHGDFNLYSANMKKLFFFLPLLFLCLACHKEPEPEPEPQPLPPVEELPSSYDITGITWHLDRIEIVWDQTYYSEKRKVYYTDTVVLPPDMTQKAYTFYIDKTATYGERPQSFYSYSHRYALYKKEGRQSGTFIIKKNYCCDVSCSPIYNPSNPLDSLWVTRFEVVSSYNLNPTLDTLILKGMRFQDWHEYFFVFHKM